MASSSNFYETFNCVTIFTITILFLWQDTYFPVCLKSLTDDHKSYTTHVDSASRYLPQTRGSM